MAGRPQSSKTDDIIKVLISEQKRINNNNKIISKSNIIWKSVIKDNKLLINVGNLFTYTHKYKHLIITETKKGKDFKTDFSETLSENVSEISSDRSENTFTDVIQKSQLTLGTRFFNICLNKLEWLNIAPDLKTNKRSLCNTRLYYKLKTGMWTDIIAESIWKTTQLPCSFNFFYNFVSMSKESQYFLKLKGTCTDCNSTLLGYVPQIKDLNPNDDGISIKCTMKLVSGLDIFQLSRTPLSRVSVKENKSIQMKVNFDNCKIDVEAQHVFENPINIESSFPSMSEDKLGNGEDKNFEKVNFDNCKIDVEAQHVFENPINIESSFPSMSEDKLGNGEDKNFENLQRLMQGDKSEDDEEKKCEVSDIEIEALNAHENWKGLGVTRKKFQNKPSLYLNPERAWATADNNEMSNAAKLVAINTL
ncbi:hypothetical protein FQA39_LY17190 [Lamprigera yunnana]|nr:hypothetical protein FQA39_LY17190 [Lamprigera yunnana]